MYINVVHLRTKKGLQPILAGYMCGTFTFCLSRNVGVNIPYMDPMGNETFLGLLQLVIFYGLGFHGNGKIVLVHFSIQHLGQANPSFVGKKNRTLNV